MRLKIWLFPVILMGLLQPLSAQRKLTPKGAKPAVNNQPTKPLDPLFRLEQFQGKWQEVNRMPIHSKDSVPFTDTLLMNFVNDKVEIKDAISMRVSMKGTAQVEAPNFLIAAGDEFTVKYADKNRLVLEDGEYVKVLEKRKQFYYETFGKETVQTDTINSPVEIDPKKLEGKWTVYRRQALAGSVTEEAVVIKSLEIFPGDTQGSATGEVAYYKTDITASSPCKVIFSNGSILVITETYTWEFSTYKADGKEFVFGEKDRLLYYAKKL